MVHLHGEHICYCPSCGYEVTVDEYVKCNTLICCICGDRMRAKETGEFRSSPLELMGTTTLELQNALNDMESSLKNGERAKLQIVSSELPTKGELVEAYTASLTDGYHISKPRARLVHRLPLTEVILTKGSPQWQAAIILPASILIGLITFAIAGFRIAAGIMPILLVVGGTAIAIALIAAKSPEARRIAERAIAKR